MATTGFWPIRGNLKDALQYAENPDKTTKPEYLDSDLLTALQYAKNASKTDRQMFVSGINCTKRTAYSQMMAVKRRFGESGKNIAYHGYQSFRTDEVTPEEAHEIGIETARRMWGDRYQVVVTTHLNTENLHNHFIVNSVSFRDGSKFRNKIGDHIELRKLSDSICHERVKSVLEHANFYGGSKADYWIQKSGKLSHRDILKRDMEEVLKYSRKFEDVMSRLRALGYTLSRTDDRYQHLTVKAPDWQRPIRLDSIGYTREVIEARFKEHWDNRYFFQIQNAHPRYKPKQYPLLELERQWKYDIEHSHDGVIVLVNAIFYILLQLILLALDKSALEERRQPLSPSIRMEASRLDQTIREYQLLSDNQIYTYEELTSFVEKAHENIAGLEAERTAVYNRVRRPKSEDEKERNKAIARNISAKIKPLRKQLATAKSAIAHLPRAQELLRIERDMEIAALTREKERKYER